MTNAIHFLAAAAVVLATAAPASGRTVIRDPGQHSVRVVVDGSVVPIPVAGLPTLGPALYTGTLTVREEGPHVRVLFQGTEEDTGDPVTVQCRFEPSWSGVFLDTVSVGGHPVRDVVVGFDAAALIRMKINGVVRVGGFTSQVAAELGPAGALERWTVR